MIEDTAALSWTNHSWPARVQQALADYGPVELEVFGENFVGGLHCGCPLCGTYHSVRFPKTERPTFSADGVTVGVGCCVCGQSFTLLSVGPPVVVVRSPESWRNIGHDPEQGLGFAVGDRVRVRPRYWGYNGRMKPFTSRIVALWYYSGWTWVQVIKGREKLPINVRPDKLTKI